jgi:flagellar hook-associated protein 2
MAVEQRPVNVLDKKVSVFQAKLSALGTLKGALSTFQTSVKDLSSLSKLMAMTGTMGDPAVATVSAGSKAAAGTYSIEVLKLAQAQKLAAAGQASSSAPIGAGTISFDMGTISGAYDPATNSYPNGDFTSAGAGIKTVVIDPSNTSLAGIRDAINKAGIGVTASIVNDGSASPNRLVLTQQSTGQASSMKISVSGDAALQTLLNHDPEGVQGLQQTVAAQNAEFKLDGLAVSTATNNAGNVIDGVTLNLTKTNVGTPTSLTVARDTAAVTESVNKFVTAYNAMNKTLTDLTSYNEATKTGAVLNGDATARSMQSQLRAILTAPVATGGTAFTVLSEIGVTVKGGVMAVNSDKLKKAIDTNFDDIASLFAAVGKPSDSLVGYTGATSKTVPGQYAVVIDQVAAKGSVTGGPIGSLTIGAGNKTMEVLLDGLSATITLDEGDYDADALAREVQSKINGVSAFSAAGSSVSVSQSGGQLSMTSNRWGAASAVSLTAGAGADNLFGVAPATSAGRDIAGSIGGVAAVGKGRTLTGAVGSPAEGLALTAEATGARGTVTYSQGYAAQFDKFASNLLDTTGSLSVRTEGINASIKQLANSRLKMMDRLADVEKRLRATYTSLDTTISKMNSTSAYLTQQLASLSSL